MKGTVILVCFCAFSSYLSVNGFQLENIIPLCKANDPDINDCVKASAQKLIPHISKGVPLLNIPPLDPLHSPEIKMSEDDHNIKIDVSYTNVQQIGLSKTQVDNVLVDLKNGLLIFNGTFPSVIFSGDYVAKGHILNYQMTGEGKANITIKNAKSGLVIKFHVENDHIKEDEVDFQYNFDNVFLDFDHVLFTGDEQLAKSTSDFINDNAVEIMNGFKPSLNRYYGNLLRDYLKGFFEAIPYSALFREG